MSEDLNVKQYTVLDNKEIELRDIFEVLNEISMDKKNDTIVLNDQISIAISKKETSTLTSEADIENAKIVKSMYLRANQEIKSEIKKKCWYLDIGGVDVNEMQFKELYAKYVEDDKDFKASDYVTGIGAVESAEILESFITYKENESKITDQEEIIKSAEGYVVSIYKNTGIVERKLRKDEHGMLTNDKENTDLLGIGYIRKFDYDFSSKETIEGVTNILLTGTIAATMKVAVGAQVVNNIVNRLGKIESILEMGTTMGLTELMISDLKESSDLVSKDLKRLCNEVNTNGLLTSGDRAKLDAIEATGSLLGIAAMTNCFASMAVTGVTTFIKNIFEYGELKKVGELGLKQYVERNGVNGIVAVPSIVENLVGDTNISGFNNLVGDGTISNHLIGNDLANKLVAIDGENNILEGKGGKDTLIGSSGNDELDGGRGSDTYDFTIGGETGKDLITELVNNINDYSTGNYFDEKDNILINEKSRKRVKNDLVIESGINSSVNIKNYFSANQSAYESATKGYDIKINGVNISDILNGAVNIKPIDKYSDLTYYRINDDGSKIIA